MTDVFTPTTAQVRSAWCVTRVPRTNRQAPGFGALGTPEEFNRWIEAHDAEVYQQGIDFAESVGSVPETRDALADVIAKSEGSRDWSSRAKWLQIADAILGSGLVVPSVATEPKTGNREFGENLTAVVATEPPTDDAITQAIAAVRYSQNVLITSGQRVVANDLDPVARILIESRAVTTEAPTGGES